MYAIKNEDVAGLLAQVHAFTGPTFGEGHPPLSVVSSFIGDIVQTLEGCLERIKDLREENRRLKIIEEIDTEAPKAYRRVIADMQEVIDGYEAAMEIQNFWN